MPTDGLMQTNNNSNYSNNIHIAIKEQQQGATSRRELINSHICTDDTLPMVDVVMPRDDALVELSDGHCEDKLVRAYHEESLAIYLLSYFVI